MSKSLTAEEKLKLFAQRIKCGEFQNIITLQLDLTDFCVCKCKGCEHWKWPTKTKLNIDVLEKNVFPFLLKLDNNVQSVVLSGGEPLLHPNVEEIVRFIKDRSGQAVGIITSGLGRKDLNWQTLSKYCSWIRFSSDGFTTENYAATRGVDMFNVWLDNLKTLVGYNKQYGICETRINVTIHEYNMHNFADNLVEMLTDNGLDIEVYFWLSRELIDKFRNHTGNVEMNIIKEQLQLLLNKLALRKELFNIYNVQNVERHFDGNAKSIQYDSCYVPQIYGLIAADGNVFPCCYMYEPVFSMDKQQLQFSIGNINKNTLDEIYTSEKYFEVVSEFRGCKKRFPQCKFCDRFDHLNTYLNDWENPAKAIFL